MPRGVVPSLDSLVNEKADRAARAACHGAPDNLLRKRTARSDDSLFKCLPSYLQVEN
jgi:hypothetical protein